MGALFVTDIDDRNGLWRIRGSAYETIFHYACDQFRLAFALRENEYIEENEAIEEFAGILAHPGGGWKIGSNRCFLGCIAQIVSRLSPLEVICRRFGEMLRDEANDLGAWRALDGLIANVAERESAGSLDQLVAVLSQYHPEGQNDVHEFMVAFLNRLIAEVNPENRREIEELFTVASRRSDSRTESGVVYDTTCGWVIALQPEREHRKARDVCNRVDVRELLVKSIRPYDELSTPPILLLYIQRFWNDTATGEILKINTVVTPSETVSIAGVMYHFAACALHAGESDHGHYILVFRSNDRYVRADGTRITYICWDEITREVYGSHPFLVTYLVYVQDLSDWKGEFHQRVDSEIHNASTREAPPRSPQPVPIPTLHPQETTKEPTMESQPVCLPFQRHEVPESLRLNLPPLDPNRKSKRSHLSEHEKLLIAFSAGHAVSVRQIARALNRDHATISRFIKSPLMKQRKKFTPHMAEDLLAFILNASISGRRMSCRRTVTAVSLQFGVSISHETIRRIRREHGLRFLAPIPRCLITPKHQQLRYAFAKHWTETSLAELRHYPVVFSDESRFALEMCNRKLWRFPGEAAESDYVDREQHPISVMVWGAIGLGYKSPLVMFEKTCTQKSYLELLENKDEEPGAIQKIDNVYGHRQWIFQQDNAPPHTAKTVKRWLRGKVRLMANWPPRSPDLSPIEHCWSLCKSRIDVSAVRTQQDLFVEVCRAWDAIPQEQIDALVTSFEARLRATLELEGATLNGKWQYVRKWHDAIKTGGVFANYRLEEAVKSTDSEEYSEQASDQSPLDDLDEPSDEEEECEDECEPLDETDTFSEEDLTGKQNTTAGTEVCFSIPPRRREPRPNTIGYVWRELRYRDSSDDLPESDSEDGFPPWERPEPPADPYGYRDDPVSQQQAQESVSRNPVNVFKFLANGIKDLFKNLRDQLVLGKTANINC